MNSLRHTHLMVIYSAPLGSRALPVALSIAAVGIPPRLRTSLEIPMKVLGFSELIQTLLAQLAPVAAHLHATKWSGIVIGERIVDPECARLHLLVKLLHLAGIVGIEVRAQAKGAVVGQLD